VAGDSVTVADRRPVEIKDAVGEGKISANGREYGRPASRELRVGEPHHRALLVKASA
jgi:hypothetical protein